METETAFGLSFDLRSCWQARTLAEAKGQTHMVLMSVIAHTYQEALPVFMQLVDPNWIEPDLPCLSSCGKIDRTGAIVADVIRRDHHVAKDTVIYRTELELRNDFRGLADRLKLADADRVELFKCVQRWVVADRRLDPAFDPRDPDAKRLVH